MHEGPTENHLGELGSLYKYYYYYYGSTNIWMPRVKIKSFGWAANSNQPQHRSIILLLLLLLLLLLCCLRTTVAVLIFGIENGPVILYI